MKMSVLLCGCRFLFLEHKFARGVREKAIVQVQVG